MKKQNEFKTVLISAILVLGVSLAFLQATNNNVNDSLFSSVIPKDELTDDDDHDKVALCHYPPENPENWQLISVGAPAYDAHLEHGDTPAPCGLGDDDEEEPAEEEPAEEEPAEEEPAEEEPAEEEPAEEEPAEEEPAEEEPAEEEPVEEEPIEEEPVEEEPAEEEPVEEEPVEEEPVEEEPAEEEPVEEEPAEEEPAEEEPAEEEPAEEEPAEEEPAPITPTISGGGGSGGGSASPQGSQSESEVTVEPEEETSIVETEELEAIAGFVEEPTSEESTSEEEPEENLVCEVYLKDHLKKGWDNNPDEVLKLQVFLKENTETNLELNGVFENTTEEAVKSFQEEYKGEILEPWGIDEATGFVYITTKRWVNLMNCSSLNIPVPEELKPYPSN